MADKTSAVASPDPSSTLNEIFTQYKSLLIKTSKKFVTDHTADAEVLGADAVQAILHEVVAQRHVTILPEPNPAASADELANYEETLEGRSDQAALIAKAIEEDANRVAALRGDAMAIAEKIGASVVTFGAAILLRGLTVVSAAK